MLDGMAVAPPLADHPVFGRSLLDLEGRDVGHGPFSAGDVAWRHRIVRVPLWALDDDDLLLLVGRGTGLPHCAALALRRLADDPLRSGAHAPGTLLLVVAALPDGVFVSHPELVPPLRAVLATASRLVVDEALAEELALATARFTDWPPVLAARRPTPT